jgi:Helix-loop-helix DNA-binding domain
MSSNSPESSIDDEPTAAQDWSGFSTLWADHTDQSVSMKSYSDIMNFADLSSLAMDMDFDPSMTVEPSALHYDYAKLAQSINYTNDQFNSFNTELLPTGFPFTFQSALPSHDSASSPKSLSSSSTPPPLTPPAHADRSPALTPTSPVPTTVLPRPKTSHTTIERRYRTNLNARIQSLRMAVPALRVLEDRDGGKKIKKNVKGGVVVKGSGIGIIESEDGSVIDVIDERGFVDGVKVARKCSKANVLGKAVEYIRVLKKREHRLKVEQAGLKTLICGLVGGPALVEEWEREWRAKFGGEEQDEVDGEDEEGDDDDSDDEEREEREDESGKKRKRPKTSPAPKVTANKATKKPVAPLVPLANDQVPEKRKRGRPRKVLPSTVSVASRAPALSDHQMSPTKQDEMIQPPTPFSNESQHQQLQPQQFLLAVFALFSFFNSPLTSSSVRHDHHSHTGTVLNALHPPLAYAPDIISQFAAPSPNNMGPVWSWQDYIQMFHLLVSVMVLASFVASWLGITFGFGPKKTVSIRDGNKSIRRHGVVDWVKMGEQSIVEGVFFSFFVIYFRKLLI